MIRTGIAPAAFLANAGDFTTGNNQLADAADDASAAAGVANTGDVFTFAYRGDNYLVQSGDGNTTYDSGTDVLLDLKAVTNVNNGDVVA